MKRHKSMVALSREHHFGLLFCWKIREGIKKQVAAERVQPYISYFWEEHLRPHFAEEERLLFAGTKGSLIDQAISEHKQIEQLIENISTQEVVQADQFNVLANLLDQHIRFEERVLFPYLENELSEQKLLSVEKELEASHQTPKEDVFADAFWK